MSDEDKIERRADYRIMKGKIDEMWTKMFTGNGSKSFNDRIVKLEVMMWIIIILLIGNGGLMAWTLKTVSEVVKK